jgi:hypothetical protein
MKSHLIAANRANEAIELRYNLFRNKWHPDLCCAVPESDPVPSFITGEQWDFGGAWEGAMSPPGLNPTTAEPGMRFNGIHLFQSVGPRGRLTMSDYPAAGGLRRTVARRATRIAAR